MEYATVIWDPSTDTNIRKLEMVQRRAARMVFSDYRRTSSVTHMLQQAAPVADSQRTKSLGEGLNVIPDSAQHSRGTNHIPHTNQFC